MRYATSLLALGTSAVILMAASQPWKDKAIPDWTADDTHLVLTDSPWSKTAQPTIDKSAANAQRRSRGMGRNGINLGGIGIGLPGIGGIGRRGGGYPGGGYPGGGYPGGGYPGGQPGAGNAGPADNAQPPALRVRWESALPVRAAELKSHDTDPPTLDEAHYAIAVYNVPGRFVPNSSSQLKKQAAIKRDGKPDLKPSSVEVIQRNDGAVVVYLFPRTKEITRRDKRIEFNARIGALQFSQAFFVDDMVYQGKLEL